MPELQQMQILVGGQPLNIGGYEKLNALLIQNNVLDESSKSIAIFHPADDLLDILTLITMGIAAYKDSILRRSKLMMSDFKVGELVEYEGKVVIYDGLITDPVTNKESFQIKWGDKYEFWPTVYSIPIEHFVKVSKYAGKKNTPDTSDSKGAKTNVKDSLQGLLGFKEGGVSLSEYPRFLIVSERSRLLEMLKEVSINGTPFFEMFPSVKCTSGSRYRLGRDTNQRSFMFYFVSSLSTADDVLRDQSGIRTLFVDARGKTLSNSSLLASVRNQYNLEDIYWMQTCDKLDSVDKLDSGLGFKIWIWIINDYKELLQTERTLSSETKMPDSDLGRMVVNHNNIVSKLADYKDILDEIPYPQGVTIEQHTTTQGYIRELFSLSSDFGDTELQKFSIHAAGIANKIFQSPLPTSQSDDIAHNLGRRTVHEDIAFLKEQMATQSTGTMPEDFKNIADKLIADLEIFINAFKDNNSKCIRAASIIRDNPSKKICVFINPKYPTMSPATREKIIVELNKAGHHWRDSDIVFTNNISQAVIGYDVIIWLFKPLLKENLMLDLGARKNFILLYPLQKKELELSFLINSRRFQRYFDKNYRAQILKVPVEMLNDMSDQPEQHLSEMEAFDLEKLLSAAMSKVLPVFRDEERREMVDTRMVLFIDGTHAFFQLGNKIKVLNLENESIETKTVGKLSIGDDIAFLKDSKRTVFEELVTFYEHKPEIVELIKYSELWRTALLEYKNAHYLHPIKLKKILDDGGLIRHIATIENWLDGTTICPDEDNYAPVDIIAKLTNNSALLENLERVKDSARKMHALRIKIGRYLAKRITQSYISPDSLIDDPVLRDKLDEMSSHVRIAQVSVISDEISQVPSDVTNRILTGEDI